MDLARLAFQPIHGDIQQTNLLFQSGADSATRGQAYLAPRASDEA